ncbi:hypothetical protein [Infirmifilum sp. SLHALR2]
MIRGQGRLAYPVYTKVTILMPGSELRTLIISEHELPEYVVVEIGTKRRGVLRVRLHRVEPREEVNVEVSHPFNVADTVEVIGSTVLLPHEAGSVAAFGRATRGYTYLVQSGGRSIRVSLPALRDVE